MRRRRVGEGVLVPGRKDCRPDAVYRGEVPTHPARRGPTDSDPSASRPVPDPVSRVILDTPRLRLRPFALHDVPALAAIRAEPGALRWMPGGEAGTARAAVDAARLVEIWGRAWAEARPGYAPWAAVERAGGALAGQVGLRWLPFEGGVTEVLWMLGAAHRGRGLATEAARAALGWGFGTLGLAAVECFVMPGNAASLAVVRRLGMAPLGPVGVLLGPGWTLDVERFRLRREEWETPCTTC